MTKVLQFAEMRDSVPRTPIRRCQGSGENRRNRLRIHCRLRAAGRGANQYRGIKNWGVLTAVHNRPEKQGTHAGMAGDRWQSGRGLPVADPFGPPAA
jgi:hypothetical protein